MDAYMFLLCKYSSFTPKMQGRRMGTSGRAITKSTSVSGEMYTLEHNDGSQSDTAVGTVGAGGKKRRSSLSAKVVAIVSRRSRSTSQLSQTGEWREPHVHVSGSCWSDGSRSPRHGCDGIVQCTDSALQRKFVFPSLEICYLYGFIYFSCTAV